MARWSRRATGKAAREERLGGALAETLIYSQSGWSAGASAPRDGDTAEHAAGAERHGDPTSHSFLDAGCALVTGSPHSPSGGSGGEGG